MLALSRVPNTEGQGKARGRVPSFVLLLMRTLQLQLVLPGFAGHKGPKDQQDLGGSCPV